MLLGDFNIDYCQSTRTIHLYSLQSIKDKLSLKPSVTAPTRPASSMPIDHVYISERLLHSPCYILPPPSGSDHSTLLFSLNGYRSVRKKVKHKIWLYNQADFEEANSISHCLPPKFLSYDNINHSWSQ